MRERRRKSGGEQVFASCRRSAKVWEELNAASENAQNNRGQMEGMQGERKMKESSWVKMNRIISRQEMQKESKNGKE